jgi:hypothetical protein
MCCLALAACASADDALEAEGPETKISNIVNGTFADPSNSGHVWVDNCSGELLRNNWIITARHCVLDPATGVLKDATQMRVRTSGSYADAFVPGAQIVLHPEGSQTVGARLDVALLRLDGHVYVNGLPSGFSRQLYTGELGTLAGQTITAFGYSPTVVHGADHDLHTAQFVPLGTKAETSAVHWYWFNKNSLNQIIWRGDSGGGSFLNNQLIGVHSAVDDYDNPTTASDAAITGIRGWILNRVGGGNIGDQGRLSWEDLRLSNLTKPAVVALSDRLLKVFAVASNIIFYGSYDGTGDAMWRWQFLTPPDGVGATDVSAVSWGGNHMDLFARASNGYLYHTWSTDAGTTWMAWEWIGGGMITGAPEAVAGSTGVIDVFAPTLGQLGHWSTKNSPWAYQLLAGNPTAVTSAVNSGGGVLHVVATNAYGQLLHWQGTGQSFAYAAWSAALAAPPKIVSATSGQVEIYGVDVNGTLRHWSYSDRAGWLTGDTFSGIFASVQPAAISWGSNRVDLFAANSAGHAMHSWTNGAGYYAFEDYGATNPTTLNVATAGPDSLYVFSNGATLSVRLYF